MPVPLLAMLISPLPQYLCFARCVSHTLIRSLSLSTTHPRPPCKILKLIPKPIPASFTQNTNTQSNNTRPIPSLAEAYSQTHTHIHTPPLISWGRGTGRECVVAPTELCVWSNCSCCVSMEICKCVTGPDSFLQCCSDPASRPAAKLFYLLMH